MTKGQEEKSLNDKVPKHHNCTSDGNILYPEFVSGPVAKRSVMSLCQTRN